MDIDVWGGEATTLVLIPQPGQPCVLHEEEGRCPAGCRQCQDFTEEMKIVKHEEPEGLKS